MSKMSSLGIATSGLRAAQMGLSVTGHNMANINTVGYTRQQALQSDFLSTTIGRNATGAMQLGLGTDISAIRQIRDKFLDVSYRQSVAKVSFYDTKFQTNVEAMKILGELEGEYKLQSVLTDMANAISEFSNDAASMSTRGNFISTAVTLVEKANDVAKSLSDYQLDLNGQVKNAVADVNKYANRIEQLNKLISAAEASGDRANDFRDERNVMLDELAKLGQISYRENINGTVDVNFEGNELVSHGFVKQMGLRYTGEKCEFVEPVFTDSLKILPYDPTYMNASSVYNLTGTVNAAYGNDSGRLKGLLVARGSKPVNYTMSPGSLNPADSEYARDLFNVQNCTIPKLQLQLDTLFHGIVKLINDTFSPVVGNALDPNAPKGLDGSTGAEIFVRNNPLYQDRFVAGVLQGEDPAIYESLYTIGNITINPELRNPEGYGKIAASLTGAESDNQVIKDLLRQWKEPFIGVDDQEVLNIANFYNQIITTLGIDGNEAQNFVKEQTDLVTQIDYDRSAISAVSLDEEMKNMLTYQHAYNAAARVVNVIDAMMDKIINGTGR